MWIQWLDTRLLPLRGTGSPASFAALALWAGSSSLLPGACRAQFNVPGAVSVDPTGSILDSIGLGGLFEGSGDKPVVDLWYFWLIIAIVIIFVAAGSFFTYRGFKRWRNVREENRLKLVVQHFDELTEDWIIDMSKRTGRPVERCVAAGARHCAGQAGKSREFDRAMTFAAKTMKRNRDDEDVGTAATKLPTVAEDV